MKPAFTDWCELNSAIPTSESHPFEPYATDGWNLNNLYVCPFVQRSLLVDSICHARPVLEGSLLRHVKSDISGMTVPWVNQLLGFRTIFV